MLFRDFDELPLLGFLSSGLGLIDSSGGRLVLLLVDNDGFVFERGISFDVVVLGGDKKVIELEPVGVLRSFERLQGVSFRLGNRCLFFSRRRLREESGVLPVDKRFFDL